MKILLIEDDKHKESDVVSFLSETYPQVNVDVARSMHTGIKMASGSVYDIMIVDMTLPKHDGDKAASDGSLYNGGEVLIGSVLDLGVVVKSIVLTQYETFKDETLEMIDNRLKLDCAESYVGCVKYDASANIWKNKLIELIQYALNTNN